MSTTLKDGTEQDTCAYCRKAIYLYRGNRKWRDGEYDETGRCTVAEQQQAIAVLHQPLGQCENKACGDDAVAIVHGDGLCATHLAMYQDATAELLGCGCPVRIVRDEGHQFGCELRPES